MVIRGQPDQVPVLGDRQERKRLQLKRMVAGLGCDGELGQCF